MARYIDADWIYEKVENRYRVSSGIEHRCERDLLDLICDAPDADVVPKSEVDLYKQQVDELEEELASTYDKLENAKAEVAREIFEEIRKIFVHRLLHSTDPIDEISGDLDELKKKYKED